MPYSSGSDLPAQFKKYSSHGKDAAAKAFNAALKEYDGDESKAYAVAHSAAKKAEAAGSRKAKGRTKRAARSDADEDDGGRIRPTTRFNNATTNNGAT